MTSKISSIFILAFLLLTLSPTALAGQMEIENGTTFTDKFTKDGMTVEVTKTYTYGKVTIHQKIWDSSGNLKRDTTTEKELDSHVVITDGGSSGSSQPAPTPPPVTKPDKQPVEKPIPEPTPDQDEEITQMEEEMDETSQANTIVAKAIERERLREIKRVYIGTNLADSGNSVQIVIDGNQAQKVFGIFEVTTPTSLTYDMETGLLVNTEQSLLGKLLGYISK